MLIEDTAALESVERAKARLMVSGQVARRLGISRQRVHILVAEGKLIATRGLRGERLILASSVEAEMARRAAQARRSGAGA